MRKRFHLPGVSLGAVSLLLLLHTPPGAREQIKTQIIPLGQRIGKPLRSAISERLSWRTEHPIPILNASSCIKST